MPDRERNELIHPSLHFPLATVGRSYFAPEPASRTRPRRTLPTLAICLFAPPVSGSTGPYPGARKAGGAKPSRRRGRELWKMKRVSERRPRQSISRWAFRSSAPEAGAGRVSHAWQGHRGFARPATKASGSVELRITRSGNVKKQTRPFLSHSPSCLRQIFNSGYAELKITKKN